ncbi:DNA gyrase/topoisomerase IV subunit A [Vibrio phage 2.275.O._10N.286.54.E11]|nr:DNA gyrase/topoisomerase IV subunit A [Vibrio phage 2.275.O._10N.286.54.E11]
MTNKSKMTLLPINGTDHLDKSNNEYAIYTALNRGIPSAWDGQKDGNRKALYILKKHTKEIKTISLAGEMISSGLYLHGDAAAAGGISGLAAHYKNNLPLIEGIGNFGSRKQPGAYGAPRYTYVNQSSVTKEVLYPDIDLSPMKPNYDGSVMEPKHFLPIVPIGLLNGAEGMAMGFSTNIFPHSFSDIIQATIDVLDGKMPALIPKYDCFNSDYPIVLAKNKFEFVGDVEIINDQTVAITNLPPNYTVEKIMEKLYDMSDDPNSPVRDIEEDSNDSILIVVKFERGTCKNWDKDDAIDFLELYKRDTQRLVMVDWDGETIRQFTSAEQYVIEFVEKRFGFYVVRYQTYLDETLHKLAQWSLVKACYDGNLPGKLKKFNSKQELVDEISSINNKKKCGANKKQIESVASLPTYRWVKDNYQEVLDKITSLEEDRDYYEELLDDHDLIWAIYREEVNALQAKTYDTGREAV